MSAKELNGREMEVMFFLSEGFSLQDAAAGMGLPYTTICELAKQFRSKMGARTNEQAIALAYHKGILRPMVR